MIMDNGLTTHCGQERPLGNGESCRAGVGSRLVFAQPAPFRRESGREDM